MGRAKQNKPRRERPLPAVTHEPHEPPPGWPGSSVRSELTGPDIDECVRVTIHGVEHLLHATTARALSDSLLKTLDAYNDGIRDTLADPRLRQVQQAVLDTMTAPGQKKPTLDDLIV
jgi:hypothetical protein